MSDIRANFCPECPSRGLCVGEVALEVSEVKRKQEGTGYTGFIVTGSDDDGVTKKIVEVVPASVPTDDSNSIRIEPTSSKIERSNTVVESLAQNPDVLLNGIARRADLCESPCPEPVHSGYALTYENVCRATAMPVLQQIVKNA